jgi:hypothetical protein
LRIPGGLYRDDIKAQGNWLDANPLVTFLSSIADVFHLRDQARVAENLPFLRSSYTLSKANALKN